MDVDWDTDDCALYDGMQFTGELVESAGDGNLASLYAYRSGFPHGPHRRPPAQGRHVAGRLAGRRPPRVAPQRAARVEVEFDDHGRQLRSRRWDEQGNLTEDKTFRPRDDDHTSSWLRRQWDAAGRSDA